ncbi:MAG: hypothetical protein ABIE74_08470 [Pseudomonadota bacterium]
MLVTRNYQNSLFRFSGMNIYDPRFSFMPKGQQSISASELNALPPEVRSYIFEHDELPKDVAAEFQEKFGKELIERFRLSVCSCHRSYDVENVARDHSHKARQSDVMSGAAKISGYALLGLSMLGLYQYCPSNCNFNFPDKQLIDALTMSLYFYGSLGVGGASLLLGRFFERKKVRVISYQQPKFSETFYKSTKKPVSIEEAREHTDFYKKLDEYYPAIGAHIDNRDWSAVAENSLSFLHASNLEFRQVMGFALGEESADRAGLNNMTASAALGAVIYILCAIDRSDYKLPRNYR